jgi:hypothetical protein
VFYFEIPFTLFNKRISTTQKLRKVKIVIFFNLDLVFEIFVMGNIKEKDRGYVKKGHEAIIDSEVDVPVLDQIQGAEA